MTSDVIGRPNLSDFPVLVVDPDPADRIFVITALTAAGFSVRAADNYHEAKALLVATRPLILLTEVRLGAFNGLQLALRARAGTPKIPVVVLSAWHDKVLQRDAESTGATFAVKPLTREELLAAVYRTALRSSLPTDVEEPIRPPFERRQVQRRSSAIKGVEIERRLAQRRGDAISLLISSSAISSGA